MNNSQIVVKEKVNYEREEGVPFSHFFMLFNVKSIKIIYKCIK